MNKQPIYSSLVYRRNGMLRKVSWFVFSVVMMGLSFGLVFVAAFLQLPLDLFVVISLVALTNVFVAGSLMRQVSGW
jgi:hypothetical protein